jgi:thiaminase
MADIRRELAPLAERVREHAYIRVLSEGSIPRDKLRLFAGEQYHIIDHDARSFALLLSRQGHPIIRRFLAAIVDYEMAAFEAVMPFAEALGMTEADLRAYEPMPGAHAYTAFLGLTAAHGSAADMAGAFVVDLEGWGGNCAAMSRILREHYGFEPAALAFFDHFAAEDPTFEDRSMEVIDRVLAGTADSDAAAHSIRRTARLMLSYEIMYWDTLLAASLEDSAP